MLEKIHYCELYFLSQRKKRPLTFLESPKTEVFELSLPMELDLHSNAFTTRPHCLHFAWVTRLNFFESALHEAVAMSFRLMVIRSFHGTNFSDAKLRFFCELDSGSRGLFRLFYLLPVLWLIFYVTRFYQYKIPRNSSSMATSL